MGRRVLVQIEVQQAGFCAFKSGFQWAQQRCILTAKAQAASNPARVMFLQLELMGYSIKKLLRAPECAAQYNQGGIEKNRNIGDHIRKGFGCGLNHLDSQYISRLRKSDDLPGSRGLPGSPGH